MPDFDAIDRLVFDGSDTPLDETDGIYEWFKERIEAFMNEGFEGDRAFFPKLEVMIAMLGTLSGRYHNTVVDRKTVLDWKRDALAYFDEETKAAGDEAAVTKWRQNIEANFNRLFESVE